MAPDWSRIHARRSFSLLTPPLASLSFLYGLGVRLRWGWRRGIGAESLPGRVVSVGGLTAGGSGKTPAVAALALRAVSEGRKVSVLSRGYGGRRRNSTLVVSDGNRVLAGAGEAGDEPRMLAGMLPHVPVVVSRKRSRAGRLAHREWGVDLFILDDGFQHRALARDVDLVLLDANDPAGNGHLLPWGPLREPLSALGRADAVVLTRSNPALEGREPADELLSRFPGLLRVRSRHVPSGAVFPNRGRRYEPGYLKGLRVAAFCGIARPEVFLGSLEDLGVEVAAFKRFRDHHAFTASDAGDLVGLFRSSKADALITTEKDWVRVGAFLGDEPDACFLRIAVEFYSGADALFDLVAGRE
jgi:tetraacyldisaccharide 4'-kinase